MLKCPKLNNNKPILDKFLIMITTFFGIQRINFYGHKETINPIMMLIKTTKMLDKNSYLNLNQELNMLLHSRLPNLVSGFKKLKVKDKNS